MTYNPNENFENKQAQEPVEASPFQSQGVNQQAGATFQGGQAAFINRPLTVKKPMKLGWIISLSALVLSLIVFIVSLLVFNSASDTFMKDVERDSRAYPAVVLNSGELEYSGLTKGKPYFLVIVLQGEINVTSVTIDGKAPTESTRRTSGRNSVVTYRFIADSSKARIYLTGTESRSKNSNDELRIGLLNGEKYDSLSSQMTIGVFLMFGMIVAMLISLVVFILFLVIFLVKNSKYKSSLRNNMMG